MSERQDKSAAPLRGGAKPQRAFAFMLLVLALLGYAGLPSNPPEQLRHILLATAGQSEGSQPHRLVLPSQAHEYRNRDRNASVETEPGDPTPPRAPLPGTISLPATGLQWALGREVGRSGLAATLPFARGPPLFL